MKTYELTYIVSPDITSEEAESKGKEIASLISSKEGTILRQSNPSARTLSYPIKKHASGFFGVLEFQVEPEKLLELKDILVKDGKIVRHMLIIKEAAMMKKERRTRTKPVPTFEIEKKVEDKIGQEENEKPASAKASAGKEKVELKDIEHELDEILG
ncbi:MAG: 30S ribosomal protein S6 [Candidatus Staskawiczbacteria bacterium]|nr:30S ribosomal protein S6 [Candidatus Staskawiczbacteria bacterium]